MIKSIQYFEESTDKEKKKIYGYLLRKGFYHEEIRQVIQVSFWNAVNHF